MRQGDEVQPRFKTGKPKRSTKRSWPTPDEMGRRMCEVTLNHACTVRATESHHIVLRSRGGSDEPSNLLACCLNGHHEIHANPKAATVLGLMKRRQ